ncbi:FMN-binding protein [Leifsonia sp. NPDC056665]|uniref:FMN-binding protein n=1 Tax=Leifsonia sp. NPDC056665 TaxID=3345901 RepID=UPI0036AEB515
MNNKSWRGTVLFTIILVVMGATVGLKLYGVGEQTSALSSAHATTTTPSSTPSSAPSATATATPSASASAPAAAAPATKTVTGTAVDTRYGPVQVKVTFEGTKITAVDAIQYPTESGRDQEINSQAIPMLQQEAMASQSAKIDTISGATYTSEGYIQSLQSAIDHR